MMNRSLRKRRSQERQKKDEEDDMNDAENEANHNKSRNELIIREAQTMSELLYGLQVADMHKVYSSNWPYSERLVGWF